MTNKRREFTEGIRQRPTTTATSQEGEERVDSADNKKKVYLDGSERAVLTEDQSQTVTNKTIDVDNNTITNIEVDNLKSGVLDTDLSTVSVSDDTLPSAKAVKDYVDSVAAGQDSADEISYDNSTSGLTATDVQAAVDEVEGRLDTAETGLSDHLADAVDAHDASAISNTASGNLTSTDVQSSLVELQTDIDTRALDSDLTTHISDTSTHGVSGNILGDSDSQTVTNKTIDADNNTISNLAHGAEVDNPSSGVHGVTGSVVGTTDTQNLSNKKISDALSFDQISTPTDPAAGDNKLYFKSDNKLYKLNSAGEEEVVGADAANWGTANRLNLFEDGDAETADLPAFVDSANMITSITTSPTDVGRGIQSYRHVTTAANETAESPQLPVPSAYRNRDFIFLNFYAKCDADFTIRLRDKTNSKILIEEVIPNNSNVYTFHQFSSSFLSSMENVTYEVESSAAQTFHLDDIYIGLEGQLAHSSSRVFFAANLVSDQAIDTTATTTVQFDTIDYDSHNSWDSGAYKYVVPKSGKYLVNLALATVGLVSNDLLQARVNKNGSLIASEFHSTASSNSHASVTREISLDAGDELQFLTKTSSDVLWSLSGNPDGATCYVSVTSIELNENDLLITGTDNVSPSSLSETVATVTNTSTQYYVGFGGLEFDDDNLFSNIGSVANSDHTLTTFWECPKDGYYLVDSSVTYSDPDLQVNDVVTLGIAVDGTIVRAKPDEIVATAGGPSVSKALSINNTLFIRKGEKVSISFRHVSGVDISLGNASGFAWFTVTRVDKNPVVGLGNEVVSLSEVTTGNGGDSTTSYSTRILNTLEGDTNFCSLLANQFTLQPGKYLIEADAPAYQVGNHKIKLRNITDGTDDKFGTSEFAGTSAGTVTRSKLTYITNIASPKTYEIQHRSANVQASNGYGVDNNLGGSETYTRVKISKLK